MIGFLRSTDPERIAVSVIAASTSNRFAKKLNGFKVACARYRHFRGGESIGSLAREFRVSHRAMQLALYGETYRYVRTWGRPSAPVAPPPPAPAAVVLDAAAE